MVKQPVYLINWSDLHRSIGRKRAVFVVRRLWRKWNFRFATDNNKRHLGTFAAFLLFSRLCLARPETPFGTHLLRNRSVLVLCLCLSDLFHPLCWVCSQKIPSSNMPNIIILSCDIRTQTHTRGKWLILYIVVSDTNAYQFNKRWVLKPVVGFFCV